MAAISSQKSPPKERRKHEEKGRRKRAQKRVIGGEMTGKANLILGIITNSYKVPSELLVQLVPTKAKGKCPFADGHAGAKCINDFCHGENPQAVSSDDCLLLDENEETGFRRAVEVLYHKGLLKQGAFNVFCQNY